jgi:hypothetical protein
VRRSSTNLVTMEACCGALQNGEGVRGARSCTSRVPQSYVKPQKNEHRDPQAIAGATTRTTKRCAELKSEAQLDKQTLHRARSRFENGRTRLMDQSSAILLKREISVARVGATVGSHSGRAVRELSIVQQPLTGRRGAQPHQDRTATLGRVRSWV